MGKIIKQATLKNAWFWVFGGTAILLCITSLLLPPLGVISPSVIQAVGELFGFATLGTIIHGIDKGIDAKVKYKDAEIEVGDFNNKK